MILTWLVGFFSRQCMCCFKDYRNFEKINSIVQDALIVGIRLIQTLPEDNEKEIKESEKKEKAENEGEKDAKKKEGDEQDGKKNERKQEEEKVNDGNLKLSTTVTCYIFVTIKGP